MSVIERLEDALVGIAKCMTMMWDRQEEREDEAVSHSEAVKAFNTVISYIKQMKHTAADLAVFTKWQNLAVTALSDL